MDKYDNNELSPDMLNMISGGTGLTGLTEEDRARALEVFRRMKQEGRSMQNVYGPLLEGMRRCGQTAEADEVEAYLTEIWEQA